VAPVPQPIRGGFDPQPVVRDALSESANRKHEGGVVRLGRADAVHEQVATTRLHDHLEPLDAVEQIGHIFVAVSRVDLDPPVPQPIFRFLAGTALLFGPVRIERPLLFLVAVGHGGQPPAVAECVALLLCAASAIAINCRCHSLIANCNRLGASTASAGRVDTSIVHLLSVEPCT
jgi:hypothetical protein